MCNQTLEEGCLCCWARHQLFQLHIPARGHLQFSWVLPVSQSQVAEAFGHLAHQTCCWGCREALVYLKGSKSHIVEVEEPIMNLIMKLCSASSLANAAQYWAFLLHTGARLPWVCCHLGLWKNRSSAKMVWGWQSMQWQSIFWPIAIYSTWVVTSAKQQNSFQFTPVLLVFLVPGNLERELLRKITTFWHSMIWPKNCPKFWHVLKKNR